MTPEHYARQARWCEYVLELAQRRYTGEELRMAELALSVDPESRQASFIIGVNHREEMTKMC